MWCVVHFPKENSVEVVPTSWYESGICKWPSIKGHEKIRRMVERKEPPQSGWLEYEARLMGNKLYDSLKAAREKCVTAEATSDLNSDVEMGRGKRKRIIMPISSGSEDEESTPINRQRVLPYPPHFNGVGSDCRMERTPSGSRGTEERCASEISREAPMGKINMSKFEEELLRGISFLKRTLIGMEERLKAVEESLQEIRNSGRMVPSTSSTNGLNETLNGFPLETMEELDELERKLMNSSYRMELTEELSLIGGNSAKDLVVRILRTIMSDSLAGEFSWLGFKKKRPFSLLKLKDVIIGAVRSSKWGTETQASVAAYIQDWLKFGKFRHIRKQNKNILC